MKKYPPFTDIQKRRQRRLILSVLKMLDLNQVELAERIGVCRSLVSRWLGGSCRISVAQGARLSRLVPDITIKQFCPYAYEDM